MNPRGESALKRTKTLDYLHRMSRLIILYGHCRLPLFKFTFVETKQFQVKLVAYLLLKVSGQNMSYGMNSGRNHDIRH
jgi:hypothetical protein